MSPSSDKNNGADEAGLEGLEQHVVPLERRGGRFGAQFPYATRRLASQARIFQDAEVGVGKRAQRRVEKRVARINRHALEPVERALKHFVGAPVEAPAEPLNQIVAREKCTTGEAKPCSRVSSSSTSGFVPFPGPDTPARPSWLADRKPLCQ